MSPPPRGRYWCFTINNPTEDEESRLHTLVTDNEDVTYVGWGKEVGESGTPHFQGYLELAGKLRLGGVKLLAGFGRAHLELRKGTQEEAVTYCKKDGEYTEYGSLVQSRRGKRNDLEAVKELIDEGATDGDVADAHFGTFVRYHRGLAAYKRAKYQKKSRDVKVFVLWGAPGVGKTRWVFERHPDVWIGSDPTLTWFDGYQGEEVVLLDDFRGDANPAFVLRLLDRYPLLVPVKGGYVPWRATTIYITSNVAPPFGLSSIEAPLARRLAIVQELVAQPYEITEEALNEIFD